MTSRGAMSIFAMVLAMSSIAGCSGNKETRLTSTASASSIIDDIQQISAAAPLAEGERDAAATELTGWVTTYLKGRYTISSQRLFTLERDAFHWQSIVKFVGNAVEQPLNACVQRYDWHEPGYDLVSVWAVPGRPGLRIAVATKRDSFEGSEGRGVFGYFELQSKSDAEDDDASVCDDADRKRNSG
jgi:hypothetical protein